MRLLIAEGEPRVAQRLQRMCREILGVHLQALRVADGLDEAHAWLALHPIDALLLELNLRGADGLELLRRSVAGAFHTIVVSAQTERALEAFECGVLDFVPKPFTRERLAQALRRAGEALAVSASGRAARRLAVRKLGRVELVAVDDVLFVQGAGNYVELVLTDGRRELHDATLEKLAASLPADFMRIHKSFIARLGAVRTVHAREGNRHEVELRDGLRLPVGRTRYKELREKLG